MSDLRRSVCLDAAQYISCRPRCASAKGQSSLVKGRRASLSTRTRYPGSCSGRGAALSVTLESGGVGTDAMQRLFKGTIRDALVLLHDVEKKNRECTTGEDADVFFTQPAAKGQTKEKEKWKARAGERGESSEVCRCLL